MKFNIKQRSIAVVIFCCILKLTKNCNAYIRCSEEDNDICLVKSVNAHEIPYSKENEITAPTPECLTVTLLGENKCSFCSMQITWMQKWTDMDHVEGYYVSLVNSAYIAGTSDALTFHFNKTKLLNKDKNGYATFIFNKHEVFTGGHSITVTISSMPMYQSDDKDYSLAVMIGVSSQEENKKTVCRNNQTDAEHADDDEYGGYDEIDYGNFEMTGSNDVKTIIPSLDSPQDSNDPDTTGMVPISVTIIACVVSALMTVLMIIISIALYYVICKAIENTQKRRSKKRYNKNYKQKPAFKRKPQVMIIANMTEVEEVSKDEIYKRSALCLANILYESREFEVGCNLWVMKDIAQKGIAMWTHSTVTSHDKLVMMCNPYTVNALKKYCTSDKISKNESLVYDPDSSAQMIYRILMSTHINGRKLIVACIDDDTHDCLAKLALPTLDCCKRYEITHQFSDFVQNLIKSDHIIGANKVAVMQKNFNQIFSLKVKNYSEDVIEDVHDYDKLRYKIQEQMWLMNETQSSQKLPSRKFSDVNRGPAVSHTAMTDQIVTEVQYDSMFSSRCNSHSNETISSCEDTGFHESHRKHDMSHYQISGAKPKTISH